MASGKSEEAAAAGKMWKADRFEAKYGRGV